MAKAMKRYRFLQCKNISTSIFTGALLLLFLPVVFTSSYGMASKPTSARPAPRQAPKAVTPTVPTSPPQYCPEITKLTKDPKTLRWQVDSTWDSYSESFVKEIGSFVGAQWIGVGVGKIICLYRGKDSFDFPIALEQVKSQIIFEPFGPHWSALVNNRKFCKSDNIFDCPFTVKPEEKIKDIYETIKYTKQYPQTDQIDNASF